jgi:uncharacterized membrane protein (Fun14 family)
LGNLLICLIGENAMALSDMYQSVVNSIKSAWAKFDMKSLSSKIGGTSAEAVQAALYFGLFFSIGFVAKKYFKFLFVVLITTILAIKVLEYNSFAIINWNAIQIFTGVRQVSDLNIFLNNIFAWIKTHILLTVASAIGFLVGYKLG